MRSNLKNFFYYIAAWSPNVWHFFNIHIISYGQPNQKLTIASRRKTRKRKTNLLFRERGRQLEEFLPLNQIFVSKIL